MKKEDYTTILFCLLSLPLSCDIVMILLNSKKCNTNFNDLLNLYDNGNSNCQISCPCCNSSDLICHGYYNRIVIFEIDGSFIQKNITIKRVKCKHCSKTHALLPMDIIPYKHAILSVIINCLDDVDYFYNSPFSFDTRHKWFKQYNFFLPYIKSLLFSSNIFQNIKANFFNFYYQFYFKTHKILFMLRKGNFNIGLL